jgi:hypothetical protein
VKENNLVSELQDCRAWLQRHLETNIISRRTGNGGHDGHGNTWAAVAIPDWDVKQRIEAINEALLQEDEDEGAKEWPDTRVSDRDEWKHEAAAAQRLK